MMTPHARLVFICLIALIAPAALLTPVAAVECTMAGIQDIAPPGTVITAASTIPAAPPFPEYCRVDGSIATPGNTVNFRLGLPASGSWNGKFYFTGNGGYAGSIGSLNTGLARGYATVSTDTGHQGGGTDASWALENLPKKIDYGYRGVHVTAVTGKALTNAYYGNGPRVSYFNGCSNGGRQAMMEVQRFPADFNGVIAGDPALGDLQTGFNWNMQALLAPGSYVPASKLGLITNAVVAECDGKDGLVDGLIDDPRQCRFDPASLRCAAGDAPTCLTDGQIEAVKKIYAGPSNSDGVQLFPGFTAGSEVGPGGWDVWIVGAVPPFLGPDGGLWLNSLQYAFNVNFVKYLAFDDPTFKVTDYDFDTDPPLLATTIGPILDPADTDLSAFRDLGGKLIMYHGWADPALTPLKSVDYYRAVIRTLEHRNSVVGNFKTGDFFRLFMVPGMHHCGGGPGPNVFDPLTALENWVEQGVAPDRIIAAHMTDKIVDRTRPLCPYPQVARYTGSGSIDDAGNFACGLRGRDLADMASDF